MSHTSAGSVSQSTGQAKNGAMASTEAAPASECGQAPAPPAEAAQALG